MCERKLRPLGVEIQMRTAAAIAWPETDGVTDSIGLLGGRLTAAAADCRAAARAAAF